MTSLEQIRRTARGVLAGVVSFAIIAAAPGRTDRAANAATPPIVPTLASQPTDEPHFTQRSGADLYHAICRGCHMNAAQGAVGAGAYPALARNSKLGAAAYPAYVVIHGQKAMPPFGDYLSDEQVAAVVNYVRTHFGNDFTDTISATDVVALRRSTPAR